MDEASVSARQETSTIFSSGDGPVINISSSNINMGAGGSVAVDGRAPKQTQAEQHVNEVDEPPKDDKDLTWLSEGKIAFYKNRPLSETTPTVFYGRQQFLSEYWREVAIKVIEYEEKNLHELDLLRKLRHPNIVSLYDAGKQQGDFVDNIYIVMELCSETLTTYVNKESFTFQKSFSFVKQIVDGLEYLHDNNVTHRDLKPDNVLFSPCKKLVKLSDFGLSMEIPVGRSSVTLTKVGAGTDGYRSPETYQKVYRISRSIDIFPLGLVTYFIFTNGKHAYGTNPYDWPVNIRKNQNRDLSQIPQFKAPYTSKREQLIDLLEKMLQHDPAGRPTIRKIKELAFITDAGKGVTGVFREPRKRKSTEPTEHSDQAPGIKKIRSNSPDEQPVEPVQEILRNSVTLATVIHEGQFATLQKGYWKGKLVTVKKYKETERKSFDQELRSLNILRHENIIQLVGKITEEPPSLVLEYLKSGNLRDYLRRLGNVRLSLVDRMNMIRQVACGMTFVSKKNFIHGNLHAQNILVGKTGVYKISGFRLSRLDADHETVWHFPIRWSAPEVLACGAAITKSDVWSFGVVMFEIFMNGEEPYRGLVDMEVKEKVLAGHRLYRPRNCPKHVFKMMSKCWDKNPADRPEFKKLQVFSESYEEELHVDPVGGGKDTEDDLPDEPAPEISRNSITLTTVIHVGQCATLHTGYWEGKLVTVKKYKETERKSFNQELRSLNILRHENIVQLLAKISEEPPSLVLEYLKNENLRDYLRRLENVTLSLVDRMNVIRQVACGMTFVSKKKFIHGDLRAQNILVGRNSVYKIADFHLSRLDADHETVWDFPIRWSAPEVLTGGAAITKSDVWSFGVVMFEIFMNGEEPYRGNLASSILMKLFARRLIK